MTVKTLIESSINLAHTVTESYLGDLSDTDLLIRPVPGSNHIAWQLGHLIGAEHMFMTGLGHAMPELPAGFAEAHSKESAKSDDPKRFGTKAQYLDLMKRMHAGTIAALKATPEGDFDKPGPESMRSYAPTIGSVFNLVGMHEMMHSGQWVVVRRKLNKPVVM